jgi:glycosyltransferase involved in cell wall biosynthesis
MDAASGYLKHVDVVLVMEAVTEFLRHENYYKPGSLVGDPEPTGVAPVCVFYRTEPVPPVYSIVMPIHNQEPIIERNLESIVAYTKGTYELILILDACVDATEQIVLAWVAKQAFSVIVVKSDTPLFETTADNIGFRLARGTYLLEIQADMEMTEAGYNLSLTRPFNYRNVIGVSGRCCHSLDSSRAIGRAGHLIDKSVNELKLNRDGFYVYETCNRGPLMLRRDMVVEMGFLDEQNFYLDYSEHDLLVRARIQRGWLCGYVPIDFSSPLSDGSVRKVRNAINKEFMKLRKERARGGFFWYYFKNLYTPMAPQFVSLK